jgi:hypothetical protein
MVPRITDMEICQFWNEILMEVLFPSFRIAQVLRVKKMKTDGTKNKAFKPQWCVKYLTLKEKEMSPSCKLTFSLPIVWHIFSIAVKTYLFSLLMFVDKLSLNIHFLTFSISNATVTY